MGGVTPADLGERIADLAACVGANVRRLRLARGWRQVDLAIRAHLGENTINRIEIGGRGLRLRTLAALSIALDAPMYELLRPPREFGEIPTFEQD